MTGDRQAEKRRESIPGDQSGVSRIKERNLAGRMTCCGYHPQRSNQVMLNHLPIDLGLAAGEIVPADLGFSFIGVERKFPLVKAPFPGRDHQFAIGQPFPEGVKRADMIGVGMGQDDSTNRRPPPRGKTQDVIVKSDVAGIHESEAVFLPDQITVDGTELGKLNEMLI